MHISSVSHYKANELKHTNICYAELEVREIIIMIIV